MRKVILVAIVAVLALAGVSALRARRAPLSGTFESPEALAAAVLDAFARGDRAALDDLAISRQEFFDHIWPSLPAARPERNLTADYVWADLAGKSRGHLATNLRRPLPGGARVTGITFTGETSRYGSFTIHRDSRITLVAPDGHATEVRLFGSVVEQRGRFKVFSYVTD